MTTQKIINEAKKIARKINKLGGVYLEVFEEPDDFGNAGKLISFSGEKIYFKNYKEIISKFGN